MSRWKSHRESTRVPLPPYSPELQPAERLWPLVNEPLANQAFETLDEVEELVARALPQVAIATAIDSRVNVLPLVAEDGRSSLIMGV